MNNTFKPNDGKQSTGDGGGGNGAEDDQTQETPRVTAGLALEEDVGAEIGGGIGSHIEYT